MGLQAGADPGAQRRTTRPGAFGKEPQGTKSWESWSIMGAMEATMATVWLDIMGYQPSTMGYQPSILGYQPSILGYQPSTMGYQPSILGYQPSILVSLVLRYW